MFIQVIYNNTIPSTSYLVQLNSAQLNLLVLTQTFKFISMFGVLLLYINSYIYKPLLKLYIIPSSSGYTPGFFNFISSAYQAKACPPPQKKTSHSISM